MQFANGYTILVDLMTAAALLYISFNDLKHYKVRNDVIILLFILYAIHAILVGSWIDTLIDVIFVVLIFAVMLAFYAYNLMGGGDVKLLTVALLWAGHLFALPFAVLLLIFILIHVTAVRIGWAGGRWTDGLRIPLAPAIAGALIGTIVLAYVQPAERRGLPPLPSSAPDLLRELQSRGSH
jgi:prepilin peptidase CpaA